MGASPTEGSSTRRIRGEDISARAMASICCSPPLMLPASWPRRPWSAGKASRANSRLRAMSARASLREAPSSRFSSTVSLGKSRRPSGTSAIPRLTISSVDFRVRSIRVPSVSRKTSPASGATMPMMHLMSVLLPLPLVPRRATVSPSRTSMETPCSTRTAPYPASTLRTTILFAKVGLLHGRVAHDLVRRPLGDPLAGVEDDDALGEAHHRPHDVLDHDDRDPLRVEPEQDGQDVVHLRAGQPGHRLVGDQQLRPRRHGARELQLAHLDLREPGRLQMRLRLEPDGA